MKIYKYCLKLTAFLSVLVIAIAGCNRAEKQTNSAETHTEKEESIEYVTLTPTQIETVGIALGSFDTIAIKNLVKANGVLDLPPQNRATVTNILGGLITKINVIQGDRVKKGEVLAFIENPEILKIQQNYLEARTQLEYAKQEYLRQKELFEERIVAGKKFQAAEAEYKVSKTLVSSLESQLRQLGISPASVGGGNMIRQVPVTSPITGFVHRIEVNTGAYAEPARPLFEIVDNHHIHVDLQVYERDIHKVKEGQNVYFTLRGDTTEQYTAEIFSVGKAFERDTRSVGVHAEIKNNKETNLLPGMYVEGRIQVDKSEKVPVLPEEAIVTQGNLSFIFIKVDSSIGGHEENGEEEAHEDTESVDHLTFKRIQVSTGVADMGFIEVKPLEKIPHDTAIVVKGAYYLHAQMNKGEEGEGHGH